MSEAERPIAYLTCPNCGADAIPSTGIACFECPDDSHNPATCPLPLVPAWTEDTRSDPPRHCPDCKVPLRIAVDENRAYAEETT